MSTEDAPIKPPVHPRPGVLTTLGICNIVFSVMSGLCLLWSVYFMIAMASSNQVVQQAPVKVEVKGSAPPGSAGPIVAFNPLAGMNDTNFIRFSYLENGTGLITNGLMFVTGIGLLNRKRWGAQWWTYVAWLKIALPCLLWSYYIVAVAPGFSESMAKNVATMLQQQPGVRGKAINVSDLTRVYSIMNLIVAVGAMLVSSLYPAISLWLLSRPGVKAALVDKPATEPEFL
jgi:hypothetical protein